MVDIRLLPSVLQPILLLYLMDPAFIKRNHRAWCMCYLGQTAFLAASVSTSTSTDLSIPAASLPIESGACRLPPGPTCSRVGMSCRVSCQHVLLPNGSCTRSYDENRAGRGGSQACDK